MFQFVFDLPLLVTGPAIIGFLCLYAIGGLILVRRRVLPGLDVQVADSEFSGSMLQGILVFYGLAVALIAVSVWQTYGDTEKMVSSEATALAALYRDVSSYPGDIRVVLQDELREYMRYVIEEAWPLQQQGIVPGGGVQRLDAFQVSLVAFEPATEGQKILHGEALRAYNEMVVARRSRLDAVSTGLPMVMWLVIGAGSFIALGASFFFKVAELRLHVTLVTLLSVFMGLVIFMIFALDRPFRGDLGVSSESYELVYRQLMLREP